LAEGKLKYLGAFGNCCFVVLSKFQEDNSQLSKKSKVWRVLDVFFGASEHQKDQLLY